MVACGDGVPEDTAATSNHVWYAVRSGATRSHLGRDFKAAYLDQHDALCVAILLCSAADTRAVQSEWRSAVPGRLLVLWEHAVCAVVQPSLSEKTSHGATGCAPAEHGDGAVLPHRLHVLRVWTFPVQHRGGGGGRRCQWRVLQELPHSHVVYLRSHYLLQLPHADHACIQRIQRVLLVLLPIHHDRSLIHAKSNHCDCVRGVSKSVAVEF